MSVTPGGGGGALILRGALIRGEGALIRFTVCYEEGTKGPLFLRSKICLMSRRKRRLVVELIFVRISFSAGQMNCMLIIVSIVKGCSYEVIMTISDRDSK